MKIENIKTPALVLDRARMMSNAERMMSKVKSMGVKLRPHAKTCKSADVARIFSASGFDGITVSTLKEAEYFHLNGFKDITVAACIVASRLDQAAVLNRAGCELKIITDSLETAKQIADHEGPHHVLIEIDCGEHRTGLEPGHPHIEEITRLISGSAAAKFEGLLTHAGHSYLCRTVEDMKKVAVHERDAVAGEARKLKDLGFECRIISVGSTPTVTFADDLTGVTEARPGVFVFQDLFQAGIGTCRVEDIALSVLATVMSHHVERNVLMIDAGGLALSKDRSTQPLATFDCGYGLVCDALTAEVIDGLIVSATHQEHGKVTSKTPIPFDRLPIGSKVRVLPNHACMTAAAYDQYYVVDGLSEDPAQIIAEWGRCNGW